MTEREQSKEEEKKEENHEGCLQVEEENEIEQLLVMIHIEGVEICMEDRTRERERIREIDLHRQQ